MYLFLNRRIRFHETAIYQVVICFQRNNSLISHPVRNAKVRVTWNADTWVVIDWGLLKGQVSWRERCLTGTRRKTLQLFKCDFHMARKCPDLKTNTSTRLLWDAPRVYSTQCTQRDAWPKVRVRARAWPRARVRVRATHPFPVCYKGGGVCCAQNASASSAHPLKNFPFASLSSSWDVSWNFFVRATTRVFSCGVIWTRPPPPTPKRRFPSLFRCWFFNASKPKRGAVRRTL